MTDTEKFERHEPLPQTRFLQQHTLSEVLYQRAIEKVTCNYTLAPTATVDYALNHFRRHNIHCAPIVDPQFTGRESVVGLISFFDLIAAIVSDDRVDEVAKSTTDLEERHRLLSQLPNFDYPVIDFIGASAESSGVCAFTPDTTLQHVFETVVDRHIHQFLVFDRVDDMYILTLTDLVHYLDEHANEVGMVTNQSIQSLGVGVITSASHPEQSTNNNRLGLLGLYLAHMTTEETALAGFRRMHRSLANDGVPRSYEHISAIPIVKPGTRELVGTLSSSDVRVLDRQNLALLLLPVTEYLQRVLLIEARSANIEKDWNDVPTTSRTASSWIFPVTCSRTDTLHTVMKSMLDGGVHRAWVCDDQSNMQGVISFSDCIRSFIHPSKADLA